jgi:hypothetical protein
MPCVRIATGKWAIGSEIKLIEAVQSAIVAAFQIREADRDVVLDLYDENRRMSPQAVQKDLHGLRSSGSRHAAWMQNERSSVRSPQTSTVLACPETKPGFS